MIVFSFVISVSIPSAALSLFYIRFASAQGGPARLPERDPLLPLSLDFRGIVETKQGYPEQLSEQCRRVY